MVTKLLPEFNKVYFINKYTLFHILEGNGGIQVDFVDYHDWRDKLIFLEKGQYIKFLAEDFVVRQIEFSDEIMFRNQDVRVLFKHLISLGYIHFDECEPCQQFLSSTVFSSHTSEIIDISSQQWYWQNPFHANRDEYHLIFDIKEVIDSSYHNHLSNEDLSKLIKGSGYDAHALFSTKIGMSIKSLWRSKRMLESKKEIAFTDKSIKEIAYELGYKDPAYFHRIFKNQTDKTPAEFRAEIEFDRKDLFVQNLYELLHAHHKEERSVGFYADKLHMSIKTLSKTVRKKLNISLGQLIRQEIVQTAKSLLQDGIRIKEVAHQLGFEEDNHFSAFFKHHTGITPTQYQEKKYNQ